MPIAAGDKGRCERLWQSSSRRWFFGVFAFAFLYTAMRYAVFEGVPHSNWPLFLMNKALSLGGLSLLCLSYLMGKLRWSVLLRQQDATLVRFLGLSGFSLVSMHVFASLVLISPAYYPQFYDGERMNLSGELSMLMGVLALWCFLILAVSTIPFMEEALGVRRWLRRLRMGYWGLVAAALHVAIAGVGGWFAPENWPGSMPPITMLSFVVALIPLAARVLVGSQRATSVSESSPDL
jgi:hypothetical protein